jgi:hypothetical protein
MFSRSAAEQPASFYCQGFNHGSSMGYYGAAFAADGDMVVRRGLSGISALFVQCS